MAAMLVETDGAGANGDDEKPTWDDDIDIDDIVPRRQDEARNASTSLDVKERKKAKKEKKKAKDVDMDGVDVDEMDADALEDGGNKWDEVEWDGTEEMRKRVLDQYMEELYELEFNDMVRLLSTLLTCLPTRLIQVAGMPTRFRYTTTPKISYGLTPTEILLADEKDLNEYVGVKKLAPYRKQRDTWYAKRNERLHEFKKKVSGRVSAVGVGVNEGGHLDDGKIRTKKRKGKKERMREKAANVPLEADAVADEGATDEPVKKKRRRQKKSGQPDEQLE